MIYRLLTQFSHPCDGALSLSSTPNDDGSGALSRTAGFYLLKTVSQEWNLSTPRLLTKQLFDERWGTIIGGRRLGRLPLDPAMLSTAKPGFFCLSLCSSLAGFSFSRTL